MKRIFITGIAGFIGFHLAKKLQEEGHFVCGIDNLDPYYDTCLKKARVEELRKKNIEIYIEPISPTVASYLHNHSITHVAHMAAQAGVRYSLEAPYAYLDANIRSFLDILESLRKYGKASLIFASSSSVYGNAAAIPFREDDLCDKPLNLYGATKRSDEVMAYSYHHLFDIPMVALRFFTVYGPWGRPDMAYFSFSHSIVSGIPIRLHNGGKMKRDFTYIDDIIEGIIRSFYAPSSFALYNLGRGKPFWVSEMVQLLEEKLGKKAIIEPIPMQPGEVVETFANIDKAKKEIGYDPKVSLDEGLSHFVDWYKTYLYGKSPALS